jgi:hypothetical protein
MSTYIGLVVIAVAIYGIGLIQLSMSLETKRHNKALEVLLSEVRDRLKSTG